MSDRNVRKLLRVLVAGGVALAGAAGARAEDDKGAAAPTEKADQQKAKDEAQKAKDEKAQKEKDAKKKGEEAKKSADPDAGGVKGW